MSDVTRVYVVEAFGTEFESTRPAQAVFADAYEAIGWVRSAYPGLDVRRVPVELVDVGVVFVAEENMRHIQVRALALQ